MFTTAKQYADAKETDLHHHEDITRVPRPNRPPHCNDECHDERRSNDLDHRYDDRERRIDSHDRCDG